MRKKINVNGIAIREGLSRNGILYTREELDKFAPTLTNKPILKDHISEVDNTIGLVTSSEGINNGAEVQYTGWVKEDGTNVIERIEDKRIKEVSIGAIVGKLVKESEDSEYVIAKDMKAMELSLTPTPGVVGTSISQAFGIDEKTGKEKQIKNIIESLSTIKDYSVQEQLEKESHSSDGKSDLKEIKLKEAKIMEGKQEEIAIESNVSKEDFNALKAELNSVKEDRLTELSGRYTRICEKLKISEKKNLSLESLRVLVEQLEEAEEQPAEEPKEETPEEPKEEVKEDPKEEKEEEKSEEPETKSEVSKDVSEESLNGYVVENADTVGMSFYRAE